MSLVFDAASVGFGLPFFYSFPFSENDFVASELDVGRSNVV